MQKRVHQKNTRLQQESSFFPKGYKRPKSNYDFREAWADKIEDQQFRWGEERR
jgi:hypothetical protein